MEVLERNYKDGSRSQIVLLEDATEMSNDGGFTGDLRMKRDRTKNLPTPKSCAPMRRWIYNYNKAQRKNLLPTWGEMFDNFVGKFLEKKSENN